jgi:alpha-L-arabinofuranosidase
VKCFLDGKLLMAYTEPDKLFALSGKNSVTGDIIVKIVNAYGSEVPVNINLQNEKNISPQSTLTTLSAPALTDENTFEYPTRYIPVTKKLNAGNDNHIDLKLIPYSINILRMQPAK